MPEQTNDEPRGEVLTVRVRSDVAKALRNMAGRRGTSVSGFLARIIENAIVHDGEVDSQNITLQEIEISTAGALYGVAENVLLAFFQTLKDHRLSLKYAKTVFDAITAQADYLAEYEKGLNEFFDVLERRASYEPPNSSFAEDLQNAISKFVEHRRGLPEPPVIEFLFNPEWKPGPKAEWKQEQREGGTDNRKE